MKREKTGKRSTRLAAGLLAFILTLALVPSPLLTPVASAASGYEASMQKLVDWGIMRGDQQGNLNPDRAITRAEFATMINRAYGYEQVVPIEFTDVKPSAWYAEDIAIGYGAGYFKGTTKTTASPLGTLTREQATVILGRNLMYQEGAGEVLGFSDSRELGNWSRGLIQTAVEQEIIHGYPDGSFRPKRNVSRGEVASILANAIGTPVNQPGDYTLGGAYGNVTISAAGTTLRNTTIAGDLYITGGLGKGAITLENVTVLGKIVVSGAGESEKGDSSVILRNVTAKEMLLDSPANQFVTLRSEGDTVIDTVNVRTHAYLEDRTPTGLGLKKIILDGEEKTALELAGNIEEVLNKTPKSLLKMAKGQAVSITMDELAVDGTLTIENGASIKTLNLDLATKVTGKGDVETLHVNAPGCKVELLPDKITIRPGLTADVGGEKMDTITAQESSEDPRLLTGYPWAKNIAPTGASGAYSTNKRGVVYWGISAITDGSVGEADLIKPPTYASKLIKSGNVKFEKSNTELLSGITGLTSGGSYYLSAVLVDSRDRRSPVKVTAFSTPDDSVPDFAAGYPVFSKLTNNSAQVTVMPTKSCQLYYALLPKGAVAPTPKDFKANSIPGNLGFGTREVTKNVSAIFTVNDKPLEEVKSYDLYLWLTDIDGAKSSAVKKMDFTTLDRTAPLFNPPPMVTDSKATSIGMTCMLNEAGDIYWTAVKTGTDYPKPMPGQSGPVDLKSEAAKLQIVSGMGALKSGKAAATANKSTALNIAGLTVQTAYDVYYVARDKAGNFSAEVGKIKANTLDDVPPTVSQEFTRYIGADKNAPLPDTDIRIVFSEGVQKAPKKGVPGTGQVLTTLYENVQKASTDEARTAAKTVLADALRDTIQLFTRSTGSLPAVVSERKTGKESDWVIDYRNAVVLMEDGKTVVTFYTKGAANSDSALNLKSGSTYYFQIEGIADTSSNQNPVTSPTKLTDFTTIFAQVSLVNTSLSTIDVDGTPTDVDMSFQLLPTSTDNVDKSICWDMLIWCDTYSSLKLYRRVLNGDGTVETPWALQKSVKPGDGGSHNIVPEGKFKGLSLSRDFLGKDFSPLNTLKSGQRYEYGIVFTSIGDSTERNTWNQKVNCKVSVGAGSRSALDYLSTSVTPEKWQEVTTSTGADKVTSVGTPGEFVLKKQFTDGAAPSFAPKYPILLPADSAVQLNLLLNRSGTIYYAIAKEGTVGTLDSNKQEVIYDNVPVSGSLTTLELSEPTSYSVTQNRLGTETKFGKIDMQQGAVTVPVTGLIPNTNYYVYFVLQGLGSVTTPVLCYRFRTQPMNRPKIELERADPIVKIKTSEHSKVYYTLYPEGKLPGIFKTELLGDHCIADTPAAYQKMTVLAAMQTQKKDGVALMGTVFDLYADPKFKDDCAIFISSQSSGDVALIAGNTEVSKNGLQPIDCSGMSPNTLYCFLAVGKNFLTDAADAGNSNAFCAVSGVSLADKTPPVVTGCTTSITKFKGDKIPKSKEEAILCNYSGIITINFNEPLYYVDKENQTIKPIAVMAVGDGTTPTGKVALGSSEVMANQPLGLQIRKHAGECTSVTFDFTALTYNSEISFTTKVGDSNGNTRSVPLVLRLEIGAKDADEGIFVPSFIITKADWDATEK